MRKKSRTISDKPDLAQQANLKQQLKRPQMAEPAAKPENKENVVNAANVIVKPQEIQDEDSYEFDPVCENCAG